MALTRRFQIRSILIVWIFLLSAVAFMDRTNISIAGLAILDELHIDNVRLGWVFSSFLLGYAVFQVAGGWLAFRFGPRRVLAAGVLWWGCLLYTSPNSLFTVKSRYSTLSSRTADRPRTIYVSTVRCSDMGYGRCFRSKAFVCRTLVTDWERQRGSVLYGAHSKEVAA